MRLVQKFLLLTVVMCLLFGCVSCGYQTRAPELSVEDKEWIDDTSENKIFYADVPYYEFSEKYMYSDKQEAERYIKACYKRKNFLVSPYKEGICINRYLGSSKTVEIPEKIDNKPVIKLGGYFEWSDYYQSYSFFDFLDKTKIETIILPSSLKEILSGTLNSVQQAVVVSKDNPYYASENGMLYNKEMNYLLYVPPLCIGEIFEIPEKAEKVTDSVLWGNEKMKTLVLHSGVKKVNADTNANIACSPHLTAFEVDKNNPYFSSKDGVLYNKDKTELMRYPIARQGDEFIVPDSVRVIRDGAFDYLYYLETLCIGRNLEKMGSIASDIDDENKARVTTIKGYKNTQAEVFAEIYGYKFIPLDLASEW